VKFLKWWSSLTPDGALGIGILILIAIGATVRVTAILTEFVLTLVLR